YAEQVFQFVTQIKPEGMAVINADDDSLPWIQRQAGTIPQPIYAAFVSKNDTRELQTGLWGCSFEYEGGFYQSQLVTSMHLENLLLAIRLCMKYLGSDKIDAAINELKQLPGRLEHIPDEKVTVLLDGAFLPPLVEQLLE